MSTVANSTGTSSLASSLASVNPATNTVSGTASQTLTAQDFMQLLTVQMENQDPTTPMDSNEEMQQIVQISSMENMSTMSTDLAQMTASQTWSLASSYLGRPVTLNDTNGNPVAGQISAINTSGATPQVEVNGTYYPLANITSIQLAATSSPAATTSSTGATTTTTPAATPATSATPASSSSTPATTTTTPTSVASSLINAILPSS